MKFPIFVLLAAFCMTSSADVLILSRESALKIGYKPVVYEGLLSKVTKVIEPGYSQHQLNWPIQFENGLNSVGNLMAQFQSYGPFSSYFHGGCDLVARRGESLIAPISGKIEAGYYSYSDIGDGYMQKYWIPLFESEGHSVQKEYFEVALTDQNGFRFEFHHVDRDSLTPEILSHIKANDFISAGTILGQVIDWGYFMNGSPYNHIHYNIVSPNGYNFNCQWYSAKILDTVSPMIASVYAVVENNVIEVSNNERLSQRPSEFILDIFDRKDRNPFILQPHFVEYRPQSGKTFTWDFRKGLFNEDGSKPKIFDLFVRSLRGPNGEILRTAGNYNEFQFYVRIPVEEKDRGPFTLTVMDSAGNQTHFSGFLPDSRN
ncbi:MAG: hypothetical protein CL676_04605 [Bdellovibrionaceae bacterium]|nr:hypothetical protein [Pseudobdellovibrionaceae bacterium]